jgi:hypothetical protein
MESYGPKLEWVFNPQYHFDKPKTASLDTRFKTHKCYVLIIDCSKSYEVQKPNTQKCGV